MALSIDTYQDPEQAPLGIDTGGNTYPLPDATVTRRASKAHFGLSTQVDKTFDDYRTAIVNGQEDTIRQDVASQLDAKKMAAAQDQIRNYVTSSNNLQPDAIRRITDTASVTTDPQHVFEDQYAKQYMDFLRWPKAVEKDSFLVDAHREIPEQVQQTSDIGQNLLSNLDFMRTKLENAEAARQGQSWPGTIADQAKLLFQPYQELKLRGSVPGTTFTQGGLLGSNLEAQRSKLLDIDDPVEFKNTFSKIVDPLIEDNPALASIFISSMIGQSTEDKFLNNAFTLLNVPDVLQAGQVGLGLGRAVARKAGLYNATQTAAKTAIQASVSPETPKVAAATAAGNLQEAGVQKSTASVISNLQGSANPEHEAVEALTRNFRLDQAEVKGNPGNSGQEVANRIAERIGMVEDDLKGKLAETFRVNRTPHIYTEQVVRDLEQGIKDQYKGIDNSIVNIEPPRYNHVTNTYSHDIYLGTTEGVPFANENVVANNMRLNGLVVKPTLSTAELDAKIADLTEQLKVPPAIDADVHELNRYQKMEDALTLAQDEKTRPGIGYEIVPSGTGYLAKYTKPISEVTDLMRDGIAKTDKTKLPSSWFGNWINATVGWIRTGADTLSVAEREQRNFATHGASVLLEQAKKIAEPIEQLSRKSVTPLSGVPHQYWKDFDRFLKNLQRMQDPLDANAPPGYFLKSIPDVEDWYMWHYQRMPHEAELAAYFSYKNAVEFDGVLRDVAELRNKLRVGTESHRITSIGTDGNDLKSPYFDAIEKNHFPGGRDNTVAVIYEHWGKEKVMESHDPSFHSSKWGKDLQEKIQTGQARVFEVYRPESQPLKGLSPKFDDVNPRYVIKVGGRVEKKPISWDQVPRRGGGHLIPDYDNYIKMENVVPERVGNSFKNNYYGDNTLMPVDNIGMGEELVKRFNAVRDLIDQGKMDEARALNNKPHAEGGLPVDWETHKGWYAESRGPKGEKIPARFSSKGRFRVVPKNIAIADLDKELETRYPNFKDRTRGGSVASQNIVEFTGERDARELMTIKDKGTQGNPVWSYQPADLVDPITSMRRGMARIINSTFMDDYKHLAVENWMNGIVDPVKGTRGMDYLKASPEEIRSAPYYHFLNPDYKKAAFKDLSIIKSNHKKIMDFVGQPTSLDLGLHAITQSLAGSIYRGLGPKAAVVPEWLLPRIRSPLVFTRSVVMNLKLGLFSPKAFFVNINTFTDIAAISPRHAPAGTLGMTFYGYSRINRSPEVLAHLDKLASNFRMPTGMFFSGFKTGEFTEATKAMENMGFAHVGGENPFWDNPLANKIVQNGTMKFLDWGRLPFNVGNSGTRVASFYTAYLEGRASKAVGEFTREEWAAILDRANLLDHNMTRASSSILHTGPMTAVGAQFLTYDMRVAEMMLGKRLTPGEKARMFLVSSLVYGIPAGGLGLYTFPASDIIRKYMQDSQGYVVGDNMWTSTFMEGGLATMMAAATGGGDPHVGNWYNTDKWGYKGMRQFSDALDSDKTIWDLVGGPTYSVLKNTWVRSHGMRQAIYDMAFSSVKGEPNLFPMKVDDFMDLFNEVSTISDLRKLVAAIHTGKILSVNETYLGDTSKLDALFMAITGLSPQNIQAAYKTGEMEKAQKANQQMGEKLSEKEWIRGAQADADGDHEQAMKYYTRAARWLDWGGVPLEKRSQAARAAAEAISKNLKDRINWDWAFKNVPPGEMPKRIDQFGRYKRIENMKKEQ